MVSHGLLGVGGIASLLFGSLMLIDSPLPELQIGLRLILPMVVTLSATPAVPGHHRAQGAETAGRHRRKRYAARTRTGADGDRPGRRRPRGDPRRDLVGDGADEAIHAGDPVVVVGVNGLMLTVKRAA